MVCSRGPQSFSLNRMIKIFNLYRKIKIKSKVPVFKVVHDMLTKKWIFVKKDKQLSASSKVVRLLEALRLPP
jgi:hypothetical protein